ncbi:electron transfer flavoprotein subunit beta/FixA family protein [Klebsiella africana]|uniref:Electron transfer flavoprotein subunit beta n=1 Tax=Klebsiella africana TaxID=2489010 RepID=A0A8B6IS35_9ENTR|nr:electron transfer flavoprotein subunit beta/FixA family protein [Klebsiella africana]UDD41312.1 electron transfer flavoprotein subunit beta/FixA family protein [Klebsiella africana]VGP94154.1 Electron transfer flavoprotein subunit beta [Klebsiella africana]
MNILLAFKAEPDAGMLAEKDWQAATQDLCGPDVSLLRSTIGVDEQAAAALLLAQRNAGCEMTLTALSIGDERALHWLRYFAALGFEQPVLLEATGDLRFAPAFIARHIVDWQRQYGHELIVTGCQSAEGQNSQTPFLLAEMLIWPCFTQVERFTLEPPSVVVEQRTASGIRLCRVRLPAVIAVRQCGDVALPVPGMRQRLAAAKAEIVRQEVALEATPAIKCVRLTRPEQRRNAVIIDGATAQAKARSLWENYLRERMQP